jgi:hypothetical protein
MHMAQCVYPLSYVSALSKRTTMAFPVVLLVVDQATEGIHGFMLQFPIMGLSYLRRSLNGDADEACGEGGTSMSFTGNKLTIGLVFSTSRSE